MKRPISLSLAVVLNWIVALLGVLSALLFLVGGWSLLTPSIQADVASAISAEPIDLPQGVTTETIAVGIAVGVLSLGLISLLLALVRVVITVSLAKGHKWARWVLTLLAVVAMITGGLEITQGAPLLWRGVAVIVLELIVLWLMWNGRSSAYVAHRSAQRTVAKAGVKG